jgi:hypothetical protein
MSGGSDAEDEEEGAFQRELRAETAEVLQTQEELVAALRTAVESAEASEIARHDLLARVWAHARLLKEDLQAASDVARALSSADSRRADGQSPGTKTASSSLSSSRPASPASLSSSRPASPLPEDDGEESGGDLGAPEHGGVLGRSTEQRHEVAALQRHIAELIVARTVQQAEMDELRTLVVHLENEQEAQNQAIASERHRHLLERQSEWERGKERAELEVQDTIEKLEVEAATYLDRLAQAQQQVFLRCRWPRGAPFHHTQYALTAGCSNQVKELERQMQQDKARSDLALKQLSEQNFLAQVRSDDQNAITKEHARKRLSRKSTPTIEPRANVLRSNSFHAC